MTPRNFIVVFFISLLLALPVFSSAGQAPLLEETIYLKHTKMCLCGDDCDGNLLQLIKPLLSKRSSVEVGCREMRLTITDEKQRVEAITKLARCYDNSKLPPKERKKECS
jgi:hypothetical protein